MGICESVTGGVGAVGGVAAALWFLTRVLNAPRRATHSFLPGSSVSLPFPLPANTKARRPQVALAVAGMAVPLATLFVARGRLEAHGDNACGRGQLCKIWPGGQLIFQKSIYGGSGFSNGA